MTNSPEESRRKPARGWKFITRPYRIVSWLSLFLFLALIGYMIYFQLYMSKDLLNSPYNKRQDIVEEQVIRGSILASDGTILAQTQNDGYGNEYRVYPYGSLFAHSVGYQAYGGSGLESSENNALIHSHMDIVTQVVNDLYEEKKQGDNLVSTLRLDLQQAASDALGGYHGAVVVMEKSTGRILADVSNPGFDPNTVRENWDWLVEDENGVFLNRVTQGLYPPGSTFKIVTALAYLRQYGTFDGYSFNCEGTYEHAGFTIQCYDGHVHGMEDFEDAMANSCNCAFADMIINRIDKDVLRKTAEDLGFNEDLKLEIPAAICDFSLDSGTPDQLAMQTAIGQGNTLASPMLMCMIADAVGNGGRMMIPRFVDRIESANGTTVRADSNKVWGQVMSESEANAIRQLLFGVVRYGTATDLNDLSCDVAGKTGTAEFGDISEGRAHSWFTGFSNTGDRDIVVCVIVEDGATYYAPATQVARYIFQTYFNDWGW